MLTETCSQYRLAVAGRQGRAPIRHLPLGRRSSWRLRMAVAIARTSTRPPRRGYRARTSRWRASTQRAVFCVERNYSSDLTTNPAEDDSAGFASFLS
jgi:hypothetical protein